MLLQFSQYPQLSPLHPALPTFQHSPHQFMSMGCTYKFFESSVSHTIFLPLPINFMPTNFASYSLYLFPPPFPLPTEIPPCDVHFCDSVLVLLVCLVHFCFCFVSFLGLGVDHCEFVVTLLLVFFIFFFLDKFL